MEHEQAPNATTHRSAESRAEGRCAAPDLPLLYCLECGMPAWVEWRDATGTDGSAYVKVRCFARHWFLLLEDRLTPAKRL